MDLQIQPPDYSKSNTYSIYIKIEGYIFKEYFLCITNEEILNIEENLIIKNIDYNIAVLIYDFIKNKYGKIKFDIGRTNQLNLNYEDIKNIFYKIKNDIMIKNLSEYKYIKNVKTVLVLTVDPSMLYNYCSLYLFETNDINYIQTQISNPKYEIIRNCWTNDNSDLIYDYMIQNYADKGSNRLSMSVKEISEKIIAFSKNITSKNEKY